MSFLTDTDVNKKARNLFVAHTENALAPLLRKLDTPQFLPQYDAVVPGVQFDNNAFSQALAGSIIVLSNGDYDVAFNSTTPGTTGTVLTGGTLLGNGCWEIEVLSLSQQYTGLAAGGYAIGGQPPYDPEGLLGGEAGLDLAAYYTDQPPNFFTGISCASSSLFVPILTVGDILGFVMNAAGTQMYFFRNGVQEAGPLNLDAATTSMQPMASILI